MSGATAHDSPYYKTLVDQTDKAGFNMKEVSADKGYISMKNVQATVDVGAVPFIAFKSNAKADRGTDIWSKMFFYFTASSAKNSCPLSQAVKRGKRVSDD